MRVIAKFPDRKRTCKYDWNVLFDGKCRELTQTVDFICSPVSFGAAVYGAARRRGIKVKFCVSGDTAYLQAIINQEEKT